MNKSIYLNGGILLFCYSIGVIFQTRDQDNSQAMAQQAISIKVSGIGFKNDDGQTILAIFKTSEGFPSDFTKAFKTYVSKIQNNKVIFNIELPEGEYALVCLHDENKNNKVDKNIIGIPKEGVGLSNYTEKGFPSFKKAKVVINNKVSFLLIKINYL